MYVTNLLFLLLVSISITDGDETEEKCFENPPRPTEVNSINETEKKISIWVSLLDADLEQIIPWIIKIYLTEILGFENVIVGPPSESISNENRVHFHLEEDTLYSTSFPIEYERPYYMAPIEMVRWGGWFIPSRFANYNNWWQFKDPNFALLHPIDSKARAIIQNLKNFTYDPSGLCVASECTILFVERLSRLMKHLIKKNKLYIKMCILETDLVKVTSSLLKTSPSMFFILVHFYPTALTHPTEHFQLIDSLPEDSFPPRSTVSKRDEQVFLSSEGLVNKGVIFQLLVKTIRSEREEQVPTILKLMKNAYFAPQEYLDFAEMVTENEFRKACDWLKKHENRSLRWLKEPEARLTIGVVLPTELLLYHDASIFEILAQVRLAVKEKYKILSLMRTDSYGLPSQYLITSEDYSNLIGIVGPANSNPVTPGLNGTEVVTYIREEGKHSFGTIASYGTYEYIYPQFFLAFDWRRVAIIADNDAVAPGFLKFNNSFLDHDISVVGTPMITKSKKFDEIKEILREVVKEGVKIIIVDESIKSIDGMFCAAFHLNMTAEQGYVWSLSGVLPDKWWRREFRSKEGNILCTFDQLLSVINGHFSVAQVNFGDDEQIMQEGIGIGEWRKNKSLGQNAGFLYDACWTFIDAINRLGENTSNGPEYIRGPGAERFRKIISETDFYGVSGRVRFDGNGSRIADFRIQQFMNGTYRTVGNFQDRILKMDKSAIVWITGSVPTDGRELSDCLLANLAKSLNVSCGLAYFIVVLIILVLLGIPIVIGFFFYKKRVWNQMMNHTKFNNTMYKEYKNLPESKYLD